MSKGVEGLTLICVRKHGTHLERRDGRQTKELWEVLQELEYA